MVIEPCGYNEKKNKIKADALVPPARRANQVEGIRVASKRSKYDPEKKTPFQRNACAIMAIPIRRSYGIVRSHGFGDLSVGSDIICCQCMRSRLKKSII